MAPLLPTFAVILAALLSTVAAQLPDPLRPLTDFMDCSGWPEPRRYQEAQVWFTPPQADMDTKSKQLSIGMCVPQNANVSGIVTLDLLITMHNMDDRYLPQVTISSPIGQVATTGWINLDCRTQLLKCQRVHRYSLDTTKVYRDGYQNFRVIAASRMKGTFPSYNLSEGQGMDMFVYMDWQAFLNNGNNRPVDYGMQRIMTRGSMSFPWDATIVYQYTTKTMPPVSGNWTVPYTQLTQNSGACGITHFYVIVDADYNVNPVKPGTVVYEQLNPGQSKADFRDVIIDTTELSNGPHTLLMRSDVEVPEFSLIRSDYPPERPFPGGTSSAGMLVVFDVQN